MIQGLFGFFVGSAFVGWLWFLHDRIERFNPTVLIDRGEITVFKAKRNLYAGEAVTSNDVEPGYDPHKLKPSQKKLRGYPP